jgi:glycosyltransferase involved in cell wall biosynthesis
LKEKEQMKIQVLVATMDQRDHSLLDKMNIQSDAIVANQCDKVDFEEFKYDGHSIKYLSFSEYGVGLNRNNALMRANSDICILADDDLVYVNDYVNKIQKCFSENPDADVIIFNLIESEQNRYVIRKRQNVHFWNFMRYGAARIAFRTRSITKNGIAFNLHFGGGAEYSAGEDTLFLNDCLKKNLKIVAVPEYIATLSDARESTWFKGYTNKYFIDRGALFSCISKRWAKILCFQYCWRHRKVFEKEMTWYNAYQLMVKGIKDFNNKNVKDYELNSLNG